MAKYKTEPCSQCNQGSRAVNSLGQNIVQGILLSLFLIPGIIYWFFSTGKSCYICGIKYNDKKQ